MEETKLYQASKKLFPESIDVNHLLELLFMMPENEWFTCSNKVAEHYTVCIQLSILNLICNKKVPVWKDGSLIGVDHRFFYKKNLDYIKSYL